jgi:hypothetical protein
MLMSIYWVCGLYYMHLHLKFFFFGLFKKKKKEGRCWYANSHEIWLIKFGAILPSAPLILDVILLSHYSHRCQEVLTIIVIDVKKSYSHSHRCQGVLLTLTWCQRSGIYRTALQITPIIAQHCELVPWGNWRVTILLSYLISRLQCS